MTLGKEVEPTGLSLIPNRWSSPPPLADAPAPISIEKNNGPPVDKRAFIDGRLQPPTPLGFEHVNRQPGGGPSRLAPA